MRHFGSFLLAIFLTAATGGALAQQNEQVRSDDEARGLYAAGEAAFSNANYEDALRYFREAYRLSGRPELLYNVAVAADRLRMDEEALQAFEQFLAEAPPGVGRREDAEVRVRSIRAALARHEQAPAPAQEALPSVTTTTEAQVLPSERGGSDRLPAWIVVGASAAVTVAGGVMLGIGQRDAQSVEGAADGTPWADVEEAAERADVLRNVGWVLAGVGLAGVAGGLVWALVRTSSDSSTQAALEVVPGGLRVRGSF